MRTLVRWATAVLAVVLVLFVGSCGLNLIFGSSGDDGPAGRVASVTTNVHWFTPNDRTVIDFFDDPDFPGVTCYLSRPISGGFWSLIGWTEDPSDVSLSCAVVKIDRIDRGRAVAAQGKRVYSVSTSIAFKQLQVRREYHGARDTLIYLSNADALLTGSPKSSTSAVPLGMVPR